MGKLTRIVTFTGLALILLLSTALYGCGGGKGETNKIVFGWLADQTGPSSLAFKEVSKGISDYLAEMEESNPIPGVQIEVVTYDTRLEYARYPQGYEWLKGQGMDVLLGYTPEVPLVTLADQEQDQIPQYNFSMYASLNDPEWLYSWQYSYQFEGRAVLDYLINQWWPTQGQNRAMKVAHVGNPDLNGSPEYQKGLDWVIAQNPGKIEVTQVGGSSSQTAWASEVASIMGTDAIFMTTIGTSSATFLKEAMTRGYKGKVVACTTSVLGIWPMVTSLVDKPLLNGLTIPHFYPLYTDQNSYSDQLNEMIQEYRPSEAAALKKGTTWMSGWVTAEVLAEAVRLAASSVGGSNVDGLAINDAFKELSIKIGDVPDITLDGHGGHNVLQPYCRMIQYKAEADDWYGITDWFLAPGFAS